MASPAIIVIQKRQPQLEKAKVRGYDISHRLHRGRYNRSFLNETDSGMF